MIWPPQRADARGALLQVLKPGAKFASYEWLKTPMYDPSNPDHVRVVDGVAEGNALPDVRDLKDVLDAAKEAGFEIVNCTDVALGADIPWHAAMKSARVGSYLTHVITTVLEFIGWAPAGTAAVHKMLMCVRRRSRVRLARRPALTRLPIRAATPRWTWRSPAAWVCSPPCSCASCRSRRLKRTPSRRVGRGRGGLHACSTRNWRVASRLLLNLLKGEILLASEVHSTRNRKLQHAWRHAESAPCASLTLRTRSEDGS